MNDKLEYIDKCECHNTGGGCLVDYIFLKSGQILGVSDECVTLWNSVEEFMDPDCIEDDVMYFGDRPGAFKFREE